LIPIGKSLIFTVLSFYIHYFLNNIRTSLT